MADTEETILFASPDLPCHHADAVEGMAFRFDVVDVEGDLRATNLDRLADRDRDGTEAATEEGAEHEDETPEVPAAGDASPLGEEATAWIREHAQDPAAVLEQLTTAVDFGVDPDAVESSIQTFGTLTNWGVVDFTLTAASDPTYRFTIDGDGDWELRHRIDHDGWVTDIRIYDPDGPTHSVRTQNGHLLSWRPAFDGASLSPRARNDFLLAQSEYTDLLTDYLVAVDAPTADHAPLRQSL